LSKKLSVVYTRAAYVERIQRGMILKAILPIGGAVMPVTIDIPASIAQRLTAAWGGDLSRAAREALAIEGYRADLLSLGQVAELLDLSIDAADGFLKSRDVPSKYSASDLDRDLASIQRARTSAAGRQ
jgi:predicted HTH domain antitoxin